MRRNDSALDALMPGLRQRILAELLLRARGRALYRAELARRLGTAPSSLQRPLAALVRAGILVAERRGREVLYAPDPRSPLHVELEGLLKKTSGLVDVLRSVLEPLGPGVRTAFIYLGVPSVPRGGEPSRRPVF